jgi:hypothetical protein
MISRSFFYTDSPPSELDDQPQDPSPPHLPPTSSPLPPPSTRHLDLLSLTAPVSSVVVDLDRYQPAPQPLTSHNLASIAKRPSLRRRSRLPALLARFSSSGPTCEPPPSALVRSPSRASLPPPAAGRYTAPRPRDNPGDQEPPSDEPPSLPSHSPNSSHVAQSQRAVHTPIPAPYSYTLKGSLNGRSLPADSCGTLTSTSSRHSLTLSSLRHLQSISEHDLGRKMHQTSSRLLRMTDDERPYTRVRPNRAIDHVLTL